MTDNRLKHLTHPGIILKEEFLEDNNISIYKAAKLMNIPPQRLAALCRGERTITTDTALRLGKLFNIDPQSFINMQTSYDLILAEAQNKTDIESIKPLEKLAG